MFFKSSAIPSLFFFIFVSSIILLVYNLVEKILPMLGLKPRISCVGSNRSTNRATTTAQHSDVCLLMKACKLKGPE